MVFRTIVATPHDEGLITHRSRILMLGSCFTDNIGSRLRNQLFRVSANPLGSLYNPASICTTVHRIASGRMFTERDLFCHGSLYHCFDCHSSLSATNPADMLQRLNQIVTEENKRLAETDIVILTFGTAWVYTSASTGSIVANCHKLPAYEFTRHRMDTNECVRNITETILAIRQISPDAHILITVSPVRHLADGAHANQLSKATLLLAIDRITDHIRNTSYFPAYELLMDDLRDYRFYATDMCHPSETAVDYIYERFAESYFNGETRALAARCGKISRRMAHRQLTADDAAMDNFRHETHSLINQLLAEAPFLAEAIDNITTR